MRKVFAVVVSIALLAIVTGCASQKAWTAMGGSRADATVTLGYDYGMFEAPQLSTSGDEIARQRCAVWGYSGAEAFGAQMERCVQFGSSGCMQMQVTKTYQCTGTGTPGASAFIDVTPRSIAVTP